MRVGLTGGIASGKSSVSRILGELGAVIIDADALAKEVVQAGTKGFDQVVAAFGEQLIGADGELDRPALAGIVFTDPEQRAVLESIVHPLVFERIVDLEANTSESDVVVHDIPLLAESGRADTFDAVIVVDTSPEEQVARMVRDRGWTEEEANARMASQATREQRLAIATHIIENTGTLEDLRERVTEVFNELRAQAGSVGG
jgi:dephospho-CoA kinase